MNYMYTNVELRNVISTVLVKKKLKQCKIHFPNVMLF